MIPMTTGTWLTSPTRPPHQLCNQWLSFHLSFYLLITALKSSLTKSQRFVSFLFVKNLQESSDIPLHVLLCHVFPTCISQICLFILFFFSRQIIHSHITVLFTPPSTFPNWSSLMTSRLKISFFWFVLHQKVFIKDTLLMLYVAALVLMSMWEKNIPQQQLWIWTNSLLFAMSNKHIFLFLLFSASLCLILPQLWHVCKTFLNCPQNLHSHRLYAVLKCLFLDHISSLVDLPPFGSACIKNFFIGQKFEYSTSKADHSTFFSFIIHMHFAIGSYLKINHRTPNSIQNSPAGHINFCLRVHLAQAYPYFTSTSLSHTEAHISVLLFRIKLFAIHFGLIYFRNELSQI